MTKVCVFVATSLDGFMAGPNDELDWLASEDAEDTFTPFFQGVGAILMGRRTYDIVTTFDEWVYRDRPVLVATNRALIPCMPTVRAVRGPIETLVRDARVAAMERNVYIDGGDLIREALDANLVNEITVAIVPIILGKGIPLFTGAKARHPLRLVSSMVLGGMVQLKYELK